MAACGDEGDEDVVDDLAQDLVGNGLERHHHLDWVAGRGDELIYRVVGESSEWVWSEESGAIEISLSPGRLMGAFNAGIADDAWGDLPMPMLSNPRVRFWFTERGWRAYGLRVAAEAQASGRAFRVVRRKNPAKSMVVYRDDWQVALLPDRD